MQQLGDPVDGRPSRRERTVRRPEGGVGSIDANLGTRATRTGRQAGREGQATGDLPLPPPSAPLATGVIDGMLIGVLVWAIGVLTLLPALGVSMAALFPTLLGALCAGGVVGPGVQAALRTGRSRRLPVATAAGPGRSGPPVGRRRVVILGGGFGGVSAARRFEQLLPWTPWLEVTLVSRRNYLLFTPMLAEVAAGSQRRLHARADHAAGAQAAEQRREQRRHRDVQPRQQCEDEDRPDQHTEEHPVDDTAGHRRWRREGQVSRSLPLPACLATGASGPRPQVRVVDADAAFGPPDRPLPPGRTTVHRIAKVLHVVDGQLSSVSGEDGGRRPAAAGRPPAASTRPRPRTGRAASGPWTWDRR